jgi:hypothetical protein
VGDNPSLPPRAVLDEERAKQVRMVRAVQRAQRRVDSAIIRKATSVRIEVVDMVAIFEALRVSATVAKEQRRRDTLGIGRRLWEWITGR